MNILAIIMADLETDFFGTASTLAREIKSKPVLRHTVERVLKLKGVGNIVLACPVGQASRCRDILGEISIHIVEYEKKNKRHDLISSARSFGRYGWRGGIADTSIFDELLEPVAISSACQLYPSAAVLPVAGGAMFLDVDWTNEVIARFIEDGGHYEYTFNQAPIGLSAGLISLQLISNIFESQTHFGRLMGYDPQAPRPDVVSTEACLKLDDVIVNTPSRFLADTPRGFDLCSRLVEKVGLAAGGAELCQAVKQIAAEPWPRELTIELTSNRPIKDLLRPVTDRGDMDLAKLANILSGLESAGDINIMFESCGDVLSHPQWAKAVELASTYGRVGITSYLQNIDDETIDKLLSGNLDVIQINIDANDGEVYRQFKPDGDFESIWENIGRISAAAAAKSVACPFLVPRMAKTAQILDQQEEFYDRSLKTTGWSVITEPSDYCGNFAVEGVFDMSPITRHPCRRIFNRLTVLSDGKILACEEDFLTGQLAIDGQTALEAWQSEKLAKLRQCHIDGKWADIPGCGKCREFHRP